MTLDDNNLSVDTPDSGFNFIDLTLERNQMIVDLVECHKDSFAVRSLAHVWKKLDEIRSLSFGEDAKNEKDEINRRAILLGYPILIFDESLESRPQSQTIPEWDQPLITNLDDSAIYHTPTELEA